MPIHVRCLIDECANIGQIPNLEKLVATIRSREISACLVLQARSQLKAIYKDNADTIVGNMDSQIFLGGSEPTTLKDLSEMLGKETIDAFNTSDTRGNSPSYGTTFQKMGHELLSRDELAVLDGGKCILQLRGVRPFLSDKYDLTQHPNYKLTSDYENEKLSVGAPVGNQNKVNQCGQNVHIDLHKRTCERIAERNGVNSKFVQRAEKYAKGVDAAEAAVPGAMEEILTGHIKATDAEITALAQTPKEEIPAIIKELRKPKKERKAKKPTSPEKSDVAADDAPDSNEVHTEDEIVPVSNSPPDFKRSIQGHKRCLTDEDRKRLRQSIDNRHHKTTVANGSIMMCEVQGAKEDFIRRWNLVFKDYPDVFEDNNCRSAILFLIDDTSAYLQTIKERVL